MWSFHMVSPRWHHDLARHEKCPFLINLYKFFSLRRQICNKIWEVSFECVTSERVKKNIKALELRMQSHMRSQVNLGPGPHSPLHALAHHDSPLNNRPFRMRKNNRPAAGTGTLAPPHSRIGEKKRQRCSRTGTHSPAIVA